jgi:diketogulonate reductase-like aldo/keto reductase
MPAFVQNRCFAVRGWDRDVRAFCAPRRIVYQGFSLLTANPDVLRHPLVTGIAARTRATPAQVVFRFAIAVGMLPLTGTSSPEHMKQDLAARTLALSDDEVRAVESLAGQGRSHAAAHRPDALSHAVLRAAACRRGARAFPG